ncbi:recombinase family protein [Streptomyces sp. NBC_00557]|uniref:recombinase family protein n=1 Tax=Streptomyces sp. NBC_00557 TaxID=2975776 RepID=UPI002E80E9F0|nr:recombinase family protein [Streptomyces sp. NBC_00557]WUC35733.1 recombinase family protein [Streptomyces sp. NBC_00557]
MDDELITERRPVAFPQVFGYLRHVSGGLARHAALVSCLTEYCRQHELRLCGVFTDREATTAARSPAFVGLLDALELPDTYGVVVPALSHLGPRRVATDRQRQMTAPGTRLIVVRSTRPATDPAPSLIASPGLLRQGGT